MVLVLLTQDNVAMQACPRGRARAEVGRQHLSLRDVGAGNVHHQPVAPLTIFGVGTTGGIGV